MMGTYPNPEDGIVARTVCFAWQGDPCAWTNDIQVLNCGAYFVFKLPTPPECALRYCAVTRRRARRTRAIGVPSRVEGRCH
jgi:hypothetical protein